MSLIDVHPTALTVITGEDTFLSPTFKMADSDDEPM
jgi:hypothetical protein